MVRGGLPIGGQLARRNNKKPTSHEPKKQKSKPQQQLFNDPLPVDKPLSSEEIIVSNLEEHLISSESALLEHDSSCKCDNCFRHKVRIEAITDLLIQGNLLEEID